MTEYLSYDTYRKLDYDKYEQNTLIWFLIEHVHFGNLCWFIEFYYNTYKIDEFKELSKTVRFVKNIRNKPAHNTPILNNIVLKNQIIGNNKSVLITQYAKSLGIRKQTLDKRLSNYNIHDILAMLYVYDKIVVNKNMRARKIDELNVFMEYARKNKHIYTVNALSQYIIFLVKHLIITNLYSIIVIKEINYMFVGPVS